MIKLMYKGGINMGYRKGTDVISEDNMLFSHKTLLEKPYRMTVVGKRLCSLLGYSKADLTEQFDNRYQEIVHPDDRKMYIQFLEKLSASEQTLTCSYRVVKENGDIVQVTDISFSHKKQDGKLYCFSAIAAVSESSDDFHEPEAPVNFAPFGYVQCTCEKYPKILYINDKMLEVFGSCPQSADWKEFINDNIYFMIPFEERDQFKDYLKKASESSEPIKIIHHLRKCDGEKCTVCGWLGIITNKKGEKEYSFVYTDMDYESHHSAPDNVNSYFKALQSAYNIIFEINLQRNTVECIYGKDTTDIGKLYDVHMTIDSAISFWVNNYIVEEDRSNINSYFNEIVRLGTEGLRDHPLQTELRLQWDDGVVYSFIAIAIVLDNSTILFCARDTAKVQYSSLQAREIRAYRQFHSFVDRFTLSKKNVKGALIYEDLGNDRCIAIYASMSLLDHVSMRPDQYFRYTDEGFSKKRLIELCRKQGMKDVELLFNEGRSIDYTYDNQVLKASLLNTMDNIYTLIIAGTDQTPVIAGVPQTGVFARTFGHFDLFVDGKPVKFSSSKEKELMALLVDRNGGTVSSNDAITFLWEDEYPDDKAKTRYRKLAMRLRQTLEEYKIDDILINNNGIRSVDTTKFTCDYYELLAGNAEYVKSFHNSYMSDYSWSEQTLGRLWDYS